jgi:response regulator RpfG family c-di-GMP phosphodiesterase
MLYVTRTSGKLSRSNRSEELALSDAKLPTEVAYSVAQRVRTDPQTQFIGKIARGPCLANPNGHRAQNIAVVTSDFCDSQSILI